MDATVGEKKKLSISAHCCQQNTTYWSFNALHTPTVKPVPSFKRQQWKSLQKSGYKYRITWIEYWTECVSQCNIVVF